MKFFTPDRNRKRAPSLVDQATEALEHAIHRQALRPGMALPSVRQFARAHGLSTFTVMAAYNRLVARGLLQSRPGVDFRVARRPAPTGATRPPAAVVRWQTPHIGAAWLLSDVFADHSISIKAGCGWLPPDWHNEAGLQHALRQLSRVPVGQMASYGHPLGYQPLREHLAHQLGEQGLDADANQILLTHGATQALDIVIRTRLRPGDHVAVETPCYANLLHILSLNGLVVHGVPRTRDGVDTCALETLAKKQALRALFVTTVLQNPTGSNFSMAGAFRVLQLAERHDFLVVEDDVSRDLLLGPAPLLAALADLDRVIHISGFSKSVMPSMRVGFLLCPHDRMDRYAQTKMSLGLTTAEMMERAVYHVLRDGRHATYLRAVRERLRRAHDEVALAMNRADFEIFAEPGAGLFLWGRPRHMPAARQNSLHVAREALTAGIWLAPGVYFDPQGRDEGWFRFNVAYSAHARLWAFFNDQRQKPTPGTLNPTIHRERRA